MKLLICCWLLGIITIISCNPNSSPTCLDYHAGTFLRKLEGTKYFVFRNDSLQREVAIGSTDTLYTTLKWTSNCAYQLTYINDKELEGMTMNVEIISVQKDFYLFEAKLNNLTFVDTIFVSNQ